VSIGIALAAPADRLRDGLAGVLGQDLIDEGLVADAPPPRFFAELLEHSGVNTDRDQFSRLVAEWRPSDPSQRPQLRGRGVGDVAEVNPARCTRRVRAGSHGAR
jgi:hypothetical protein